MGRKEWDVPVVMWSRMRAACEMMVTFPLRAPQQSSIDWGQVSRDNPALRGRLQVDGGGKETAYTVINAANIFFN